MTFAANPASTGLSWWHIIRLGLIQTSLGGIVVLTTSTLNRIMVVELALAATIPGFLVTIHHVVQLARPRIGYGSDVGGRRTPWIIGGMFILGLGGVLAALGTTLIPKHYWLGLLVSALGKSRLVHHADLNVLPSTINCYVLKKSLELIILYMQERDSVLLHGWARY